MSQLDILNFSTQLFWLFICFFIGYFLLVKFFLPKLFYIVRFRAWLLKILKKEVSGTISEIVISEYSYSFFLINTQKRISKICNRINRKLLFLKGTIFF